MNADIRVCTNILINPRFRRLEKCIGASALAHWIKLQIAVATTHSDGNLPGWTKPDIEIAAEWHVEEGVFADALIELGFIDATETGFVVRDWGTLQPFAAREQERIETARKGGQASAEVRKQKHGTAQPHKPERLSNSVFDDSSELSNSSRTDLELQTKPKPTQKAKAPSQGENGLYVNRR